MSDKRTATRSARVLQLRAHGFNYRKIVELIKKEFPEEKEYTFKSAQKDYDRAISSHRVTVFTSRNQNLHSM